MSSPQEARSVGLGKKRRKRKLRPSRNVQTRSEMTYSPWEMRAREAVRPKLNYLGHRSRWGGAQALQLGCGAALCADGMVRRGADVTAMDTTSDLLASAQKRTQKIGYRIQFLVDGSHEAQGLPGNEFDIVLCDHALEFSTDPGSLIRRAAFFLKPGGTFMFACLNRTLVSRLMLGMPLLRLPGLRVDRPLCRALTPKEVRLMTEQAGLEDLRMTGLRVRPRLFGRAAEPSVHRSMQGIFLGYAFKPMG